MTATMNETELQSALEAARELARRAGRLVADYFHRGVEVQRKAGNEPVTRADREAQALILEGLRGRYPEHGVLAEESAEQRAWAARRWSWVVDPLDGTSDFVAGRTGFAVMIGLLDGERPVLGVVHEPIERLTYRARDGAGAELIEEADGERPERRIPLRTSSRAELAGLRLVSSRSHRSQRIEELKRLTGITDELQLGSVGLKVGLIARGERDLYLHPSGRTRLWDTCAPEVILREAGGVITDLQGQPLRYRPEELEHRHGLFASNGACHRTVLQAIAPLFPRE